MTTKTKQTKTSARRVAKAKAKAPVKAERRELSPRAQVFKCFIAKGREAAVKLADKLELGATGKRYVAYFATKEGKAAMKKNRNVIAA
jgi:hypothetical protein